MKSFTNERDDIPGPKHNTGWLFGPKIGTLGQVFAKLVMDETVKLRRLFTFV